MPQKVVIENEVEIPEFKDVKNLLEDDEIEGWTFEMDRDGSWMFNKDSNLIIHATPCWENKPFITIQIEDWSDTLIHDGEPWWIDSISIKPYTATGVFAARDYIDIMRGYLKSKKMKVWEQYADSDIGEIKNPWSVLYKKDRVKG